MNSTDWLITATVAGPLIGALASPGLGKGILSLARARARRVEHVAVSGTDLYSYGVPLTEAQFREAYAAMQADLDELPAPASRSDWELQHQCQAVNRFSMLTGTFPQAYPMLGDADSAWRWYMIYNAYTRRNTGGVTASQAIGPGTGRRLLRLPWNRTGRRTLPGQLPVQHAIEDT